MKTQDILTSDSNLSEGHDSVIAAVKPDMTPDHEVQMARADLYKLAKYAIKLHELIRTIPEEKGLEGWVQSKITKASDYISSVYHYLDYDMKMGESVNEAPVPPAMATAATGTAANPQAAAALVAAQVTAKKKEIQDQIKAKQTEIANLQKQLAAVGTGKLVQSAYESASAGATSSGGIATATGNGFKNGGPGTMTRAKKVKEASNDPDDMFARDAHGHKAPGVKKLKDGKFHAVNAAGEHRIFNSQAAAERHAKKTDENTIGTLAAVPSMRKGVEGSAKNPVKPEKEKDAWDIENEKANRAAAAKAKKVDTSTFRFKNESVEEGLNDPNIQSAIIDTVEKLFYKNDISDYGALEAIRQGVKHHFSKPNATTESAIQGILNILDKRMHRIGNSLDLNRFREALRQGVAHQLKKQGVEEGTMTYAGKEGRGPKFTGYWKGKDKGRPGNKMVGSD